MNKEILEEKSLVCKYSPFPQGLKAGKKYKILAEYKDRVAIIDETKELVVYHKCYFTKNMSYE
jgi:hypothetical protein